MSDANLQGCAIEVANVTFGVEGKVILHDVTLRTSTKRIGIVGRNGSGKSTLARVIAGLVCPRSGAAKINGHDMAKDRKQALREVGILFQNPDHQIIFPTVREEISFGLRQMGQSKADADRVTVRTLESFAKSHWIDAHVHALSQGQKHLVCLMAIVAMAPKVVILDEPFTGLDIPTKAQLTRYLGHYEGSLVHITHDPDDLRGYDHVVWLEQGRIVDAGEAEAVLQAYVTAMTEMGGTDDISDITS